MHRNAHIRYSNAEVLHGILSIEYLAFVVTNIMNYTSLHREHNHKGGDFEQKQLIFPTAEVQNVHANFPNVCCRKYSNV